MTLSLGGNARLSARDLSSVPINDFADANEESVLTKLGTEQYVLYMLREGYVWRVHGLLQ